MWSLVAHLVARVQKVGKTLRVSEKVHSWCVIDKSPQRLQWWCYNWWSIPCIVPPPQVTPRPRSGPSGACAPSRVAKAGKWGRAPAFPPHMGRFAAVPCGRHACATTPPPVPVNLESWARVRVNLFLFFFFSIFSIFFFLGAPFSPTAWFFKFKQQNLDSFPLPFHSRPLRMCHEKSGKSVTQDEERGIKRVSSPPLSRGETKIFRSRFPCLYRRQISFHVLFI